MATFKAPGLEIYVRQLQRLSKETDVIVGEAVYIMAKVVADEVRKNLAKMPSVPDTHGMAAYRAKTKIPITNAQKWDLENSFGIAGLKNENGYLNVKLGFDGYNRIKTKAYPNGQPNAMIARAIESGTSNRDKYPFIRPAVQATRKQAIAAAAAKFDEEIRDIVK